MTDDMTNEKAKEIMKCWYLNLTEGMIYERLGYIEGWFNKEDKLAFELAIKALEAQTVPQVTVFTETADEKAVADLKAELQNVLEARPQGDLISRSDLKEVLKRYRFAVTGFDGILFIIDNAQAVKPEITEEQAIDTLLKTGWLVRHDKEITNDRTETDPHH